MYFYHGETKTIFVKPLVPEARKQSAAMVLPADIEGGGKPLVDLNEVLPGREKQLQGYLRRVKDPRKARGIRHTLVSVLAVAVCAVLAGNLSFRAIGGWAANLGPGFFEEAGVPQAP